MMPCWRGAAAHRPPGVTAARAAWETYRTAAYPSCCRATPRPAPSCSWPIAVRWGCRHDGCVDIHSRRAELAFELREPVSSWRCRPMGTPSRSTASQPSSAARVACALTKAHPHRFDRLSWLPDALRGIASIDYARMEMDDEPGGAFEHDDDSGSGRGTARGGELVGFLSAADVAAARAAHRILVLEVAYAWCDKCAPKRPTFLRTAALMGISAIYPAITELPHSTGPPQPSSAQPGSAGAHGAARDGVGDPAASVPHPWPTELLFGSVDAREERELRSRLGDPGCDYSCSVLVWPADEPKPIRIRARGDGEAHLLAADIRACARPPLHQLRTWAELEAFRSSSRLAVVAAGPDAISGRTGSEGFLSGSLRDTVHEVARHFRLEYNFSWIDSSSLPLSAAERRGAVWPPVEAGLTLYREAQAGGDGGSGHLGWESTMSLVQEGGAQGLSAWLRTHALDDVMTYTWEARNEVESLGLAPLCIFIDDAPASPHPAQSSAATTREALRSFLGRAAAAALAAEYKGVLAVLVLPRSTSAYMLADYALPTRHTGGGGDTVGDFAPPALGLSRSFDYDAPKFGYRGEGGLADAAGVRAWIERFLAGSLAPTYQSAPPPAAPHVAGRVRVVVGDTIADEVKLRVLCGGKS
mmetsp:Transcript_3230/g.10202  ORF Transcript_3230/g.10202 Transcript_3230/m.10202 type:complete len:643 (+) Transcript_3230:1170-3098(+)